MKKNMIKLGDVATYINGYAFKPEDRGEVGLPIIRIQDLTGNAYDLGFYNGDYPKRIEINDGDVLISWSASLGVYVWNRGRALLNQHIFKVEFDKVNIDKSYFVYAVRQKLAEMAMKTHGATMKHIVKKDFEETLIPYPSQKKQIEIGTNLDKIANIIAARKQQLELLDELVKARFVEMFGDENNSKNWNIINVENVADVQVGIVIKPSQYYTNKGNGVKAFRSLNIGEGFIKDNDWVYFTEEGHNKNSKSIVKENDLLIVRSGAPGTACVVTEKYTGYNAIDIIIVHPDCEKINPYYLCYFTNMQHGKKQINEGTSGAAQQHFNVGKYNKLRLMLPPKELQDEFADFVHQIDKSKVNYYYKNRKDGFPPLLLIYSVTTIINLSDY
ncbi:restriction endonuclease subunit S [Clostridium sp. AF34-13]|uniref:restriction endonuclease subunit S n=1 Tax=Clostridium sp. AF34-13 TaxID=2293012 RepID=UPI001A9B2000|nr:restriction endonuclease subunit S [Clostridium sp. AF34-13]